MMCLNQKKLMIVLLVKKNNCIEYISEGDEYKNFSLEGYLDMIRPRLIDLINSHNQYGEWKIQLVLLNRCISSKNFDKHALCIQQVII